MTKKILLILSCLFMMVFNTQAANEANITKQNGKIKIALASNNKGKIRELKNLLPENFEIIPEAEFWTDTEIPAAEENKPTFIENALIKARAASRVSGLPAIADDSGISVDALNGGPGVFSARYSKGEDYNQGSKDENNNTKMLQELANVPNGERNASYHATLVFVAHADDPSPIIVYGSLDGEILHERVGSNGFAYDTIFYVKEKGCSAAELTLEEKNQISHRAKATKELASKLTELFNK